MQALACALAFAPLCSLPFSPAQAQTAADPAAGTVMGLDNALIATMKSGGSMASRMAALGPRLDQAFDLGLMTRLAVGPAWNQIAPAEQQALVAAFRRMTVAEYARNFDKWSGESFSLDPQVQQRGTDKLVRTTLNIKGKAPIAISYRLRQSGGSWKIIDVFYKNAISQIATRRSDFASVLSKGGAKALVAHMNALASKS